MQKRNPNAAVSVEELQSLGSDLVPLLLEIVEERADAADVTFMKIARRLPDGWRQIVMAAHAIEDIEEAECLAGAFADIRTTKDVVQLEQFFEQIGAKRLARAFATAREDTAVLVDEDMDPLEIDELRDVGSDELELRAARSKIAERARSMTMPFPAVTSTKPRIVLPPGA